MEVNIHSGSTPILKQWIKLISNPRNKERLAELVCENLIKQQLGHLGPFHKVLLAGGFTDGSRTVSLAQGSTAAVPQLRSHKEEVDTRLLLHAKHATSTHPQIVTQSPDTDVAVLAVAHFKDLGCQELWLQTGAKDKERYIPLHTIHSSLGPSLCKCLPSFHALTECDSTSAFVEIGKKKPWKVLIMKDQLQTNLSSLGENPVLQESVQSVAESFICSVYISAKSFSSTDEARHFLFCQRSLKSEDLSPTSDCLCQHLKRANYHAFIWNRALALLQVIPSPEANGWKLDSRDPVPALTTKSPARPGITELTRCRCTNSGCTRNCSCKSSNLACTEACLCMADEKCCNPSNEEFVSSSESTDSESE